MSNWRAIIGKPKCSDRVLWILSRVWIFQALTRNLTTSFLFLYFWLKVRYASPKVYDLNSKMYTTLLCLYHIPITLKFKDFFECLFNQGKCILIAVWIKTLCSLFSFCDNLNWFCTYQPKLYEQMYYSNSKPSPSEFELTRFPCTLDGCFRTK